DAIPPARAERQQLGRCQRDREHVGSFIFHAAQDQFVSSADQQACVVNEAQPLDWGVAFHRQGMSFLPIARPDVEWLIGSGAVSQERYAGAEVSLGRAEVRPLPLVAAVPRPFVLRDDTSVCEQFYTSDGHRRL